MGKLLEIPENPRSENESSKEEEKMIEANCDHFIKFLRELSTTDDTKMTSNARAKVQNFKQQLRTFIGVNDKTGTTTKVAAVSRSEDLSSENIKTRIKKLKEENLCFRKGEKIKNI